MNTEVMIIPRMMIAVAPNIQHCSSHFSVVAESNGRMIFKVQIIGKELMCDGNQLGSNCFIFSLSLGTMW